MRLLLRAGAKVNITLTAKKLWMTNREHEVNTNICEDNRPETLVDVLKHVNIEDNIRNHA